MADKNKTDVLVEELNATRARLHSERDAALIEVIDALVKASSPAPKKEEKAEK